MSKEVIYSYPFCGNTNVEIARTNPNACWVCCDEETGCGAEAKSAKTRRQAVANWNQRAQVVIGAIVVQDDDAEHKARAKR